MLQRHVEVGENLRRTRAIVSIEPVRGVDRVEVHQPDPQSSPPSTFFELASARSTSRTSP